MSDEISVLIRKYVLMNAIRHKGRAEVGSVLGRVLADRSELRSQGDEVRRQVQKIVDEINSLSLSAQKETAAKYCPDILEEQRVEYREKGLLPLPNAERYDRIVTRFSPNPDCVLHLGSARAVILSHDYAKKYAGVFILRFEDTDPKGKPPRVEFYAAIREDLSWLGCDPDEEFIQSDRLPIYYDFARRVLNLGYAYVCKCRPEDFRVRISAREPCPCRSRSPKENVEEWERMVGRQYAEGEAVVRIKTDLNHPNPAVRDWPALRIIDTELYPHPRTGNTYRVWPLYNFACGVDDHLMGITHIIRGKEHLTNETRQRYLYEHLGWKYPETIHYGRLRIVGSVLSKSRILVGVRAGEYDGWDDPRLATLIALRKRGIAAETIRRMIHEVGLSPVDATLSWKTLYAYNRKLIDGVANRYFFVSSPLEMTVSGIPSAFTPEIPMHPEHKERGYRVFEVIPKDGMHTFYVSENDREHLVAGEVIRLIGLFNVRIISSNGMINASFAGASYEEAHELGAQLIHWVPSDSWVDTRVLMPDNSVTNGLSEKSVLGLKPNQIIQFERYGFVCVDSVGEILKVRFTHS